MWTGAGVSDVITDAPFIREGTVFDAMTLSQRLRKEDREEVYHAARKTPWEALMDAFAHPDSRVFAVQWGADPIAMFGVVGTKETGGSPWMLASDELKGIRKTFLRECRPVVEGWLKEYGTLTNAVWSKNTEHIRWIRWLGFNFQGSHKINGETFLQFHRSANV